MSEYRYPLIAYLDPSASAVVRSLQAKIRELSGSQAAMHDWDPHITLGSEVWVKDKDLGQYESDLHEAVSSHRPFSVSIQDYGFIDDWTGGNLPGNSPYGIFLNVNVTPELQDLATAVETVASRRKLYFKRPAPYLPHVTLAFRDLDRAGYDRAKAALTGETFSTTTIISHVSLAKVSQTGHNFEAARIPLS